MDFAEPDHRHDLHVMNYGTEWYEFYEQWNTDCALHRLPLLLFLVTKLHYAGRQMLGCRVVRKK